MRFSFLSGSLEVEVSRRLDGHGLQGRLASQLSRQELPYAADAKELPDGKDIDEVIGYNGALEGLEALLLSLCCEGLITKVDARVDSAIQTALDAINNAYE